MNTLKKHLIVALILINCYNSSKIQNLTDKNENIKMDEDSPPSSPSLLSNYSFVNEIRNNSMTTGTGTGDIVSESSVCSSVIIDIEEEVPERTVIPESDSESLTDFEGSADSNLGETSVLDANEDNANDNGDMEETDFVVGSTAGITSDADDNKKSASQFMYKDIVEKMSSIEDFNRKEFARLKRFSSHDKIFPGVRSSSFHTVAVLLTDDFKPGDALIPYPAAFNPKWHTDYVPMPCNPENVRTVRKPIEISDQSPDADNGEENKSVFKEVTIRLWDRIRSSLNQPLNSCEDIANAVKSYHKFRGSLTVLEYTLNVLMSSEEKANFFSVVLPGMVKLCLSLPNLVTCAIPFLTRFMNYSITLSQKQIASLLANAFFSTFPVRFSYEEDFSSINFISLLTGDDGDDRIPSKAHKVRCLLHYFERVLKEMPMGVVTYTRKSVRTSKAPDWSKSTKPLSQFITRNEGTIETDGERLLQIDFANKYIGGGALSRGCVQEEILFVIYPELILSRLFTERLVSCEAVIITGCERFSRYKGYAESFEFDGDFVDCIPWNQRARKCTQIVAIDAQYVIKHVDQFHPQKLTREVNKAYIGFSNPPGTSTNVAVATGKWGCGAFKGDAHLKAVIQILASSQAERPLVFFTFGDLWLQKELEEIYTAIKDKKIQEVWTLLKQYNNLFCTRPKPLMNLHEFLTEYFNSSKPSNFVEEMETDQETSGSSKKEQEGDEAQHRKPGLKFKKLFSNIKSKPEGSPKASRKSMSKDWLNSLEQAKSGWNSVKSPSPTEADFSFEPDRKLSDKEVYAYLDYMETECPPSDLSTNEIPVPVNEGTPKPKNVPFLKNDINSSNSEVKSPLFSKRSNSASADTSDIGAALNSSNSESNCGIPKQKRQMTLKDFYKPLS